MTESIIPQRTVIYGIFLMRLQWLPICSVFNSPTQQQYKEVSEYMIKPFQDSFQKRKKNTYCSYLSIVVQSYLGVVRISDSYLELQMSETSDYISKFWPESLEDAFTYLCDDL